MHPFVLLMLTSGIVSAVLASAILARQPGARLNRVCAAVLGCGSAWALLDVYAACAQSSAEALPALRAVSLAYLLMGPLTLHAAMLIRRDSAGRDRMLLRFAYGLALGLGFASCSTPWFVVAAEPVVWGFAPVFGPAFAVSLCAAAGIPAVVFFLLVRSNADSDRVLRGADGRATAVGIGLALVVVLITDVLVPMVDPNGPRLATSSVALIGGVLWLRTIDAGGGMPASGTAAREILDNMTSGVAVLARDGRVRAVNRSLAALLRMAPETAEGISVASLFSEPLEKLETQLAEHETMLHLEAGERIPVSISTDVIRDRRDSPIGLVLVVKDQRKVVELRRQLVTSGRLVAVGELAAGIAHEVNNPIAFIQANLNLLTRHLDEVETTASKQTPSPDLMLEIEKSRRHTEDSLTGIGRVASIVRQVRGLAHSGEGESGLQDVNAILDSAVTLATLHLGDSAEVLRHYGVLPPVECSGQDLRQVFLGLVLNSTRAIGRSGAIRLSTEHVEDEVVVRIEDDGRVAAPQLIERGFDPGLHPSSSTGVSGLALSLAYQILRQLEGNMSVVSNADGGTCVSVHLPAWGAPVAAHPESVVDP